MAIVPQTATSAYPGRSWNARLYPGTLATTARFREDLRHDLAELAGSAPDLLDDLLLCGSEMFANAVNHTRSGHADGRVVRTLSVPAATDRGSTLRLSVIDDGLPDDSAGLPRIPVQRTAQEWEDAECGRGLLLVANLAAAWGTRAVVDFPFCGALGMVVWAEFTHTACSSGLAAGC
ncbi:ATP-binding protein [Streptomonospora nanhaiensis]|uniref:ATP-binding protein n=1 Tax=Streptomonospora nanhaiensis TaxID=1323731 RepID=A0ABY6YTF1_9ACTN|nr:ATP-binding protein [Streptomonospora nanhaiensis]WAE75502.1 ATP-binding protein [Streptomonospora nanhaiensis]